MSSGRRSTVFVVLLGAGLIALAVWVGYGILKQRQPGIVSSPQATTAASNTPTQEIVPSALPTHATDGQGNPVSADELKRNREYKLGRSLGDCLSQGCQVFLGIVREIGPAEKKTEEPDDWAIFYRKVNLSIDEWLWGDRQQLGSTVQILYAAKPQVFKSAPGPWSVWEGVGLKVNEKILVALWDAKARANRYEEIAVVISDNALIERLHESVNLHVRLSQSPDQIEQILDPPKISSDFVLTGYLVAYLIRLEAKSNVDRAAVILALLLSLKHLPGSARNDVASELTSVFARLSAERRRTIAESLIATAADDDLNQATTALSSLISLTDSKLLDLRSIVSVEQRRKLSANYRAALSQGRIEKGHVEFESQLRLVPSAKG